MNSFGSPASVVAPPILSTRPVHSAFITVLGWGIVGVSALASIVSLMALLMILAGSQGSANGTLLGGFVVIGVPPLTLIAGVGLVCRWRLAYGYLIVLLGWIAGWNIVQMLRGSTPEHSYTSASGVPTTVLASYVNYPVHFLVAAVSLGLLWKLLNRPTRVEFR